MALLLLERDAVPPMVVTDSNKKLFTAASDEYIVFVVDGHTIFCEDGNGVVVCSFSNAHEQVGEVIEGVDLGGLAGELLEWQLCDMFACAAAPVGHSVTRVNKQ